MRRLPSPRLTSNRWPWSVERLAKDSCDRQYRDQYDPGTRVAHHATVTPISQQSTAENIGHHTSISHHHAGLCRPAWQSAAEVRERRPRLDTHERHLRPRCGHRNSAETRVGARWDDGGKLGLPGTPSEDVE